MALKNLFTLDAPGTAKNRVDDLGSKEAPYCTPSTPGAEIDQKKKVNYDS